jgi:hypothetical protein
MYNSSLAGSSPLAIGHVVWWPCVHTQEHEYVSCYTRCALAPRPWAGPVAARPRGRPRVASLAEPQVGRARAIAQGHVPVSSQWPYGIENFFSISLQFKFKFKL